MKYVHFQINRNSLFTNYKVNKFKPNVSPGCTLCELEEVNDPPPELISHLFYECVLVKSIWQEIQQAGAEPGQAQLPIGIGLYCD